MRQPTVLLAHGLDESAEARLDRAVHVIRPAHADEAGLAAAVGDCDGLIGRTSTPITRRVLEAGRRLRVVGIAGVGLDNVDLTAADELGIEVLHTPAAASDAVAELTVSLMLQLVRPTASLSERYRAGEFASLRETPAGRELRELTVGILGMGRIGSRVGRIVSAGFGARTIYHDVAPVGPFPFAAQSVDRATLWRECDILTLHVPLTDRTRGSLDEAAFAALARRPWLVNTARGAVVVTDALVAALRAGQIAGAALDVTDPEPLPAGHPLFSMRQCVVLPHVAARTPGGMRRMFAVVDDVIARLTGQAGPTRPSAAGPVP